MCTYFGSPATLLHRACLWLTGPASMLQGLCVLWAPQASSAPWSLCALERFVCHTFLGNLGMPSAPHGLCALERFVCCATLSYPGLSSALQGLCVLQRFVCCPSLGNPACLLCCGTSMGFSQFPKPAVWSGPQSEHLLWAENCSFLCFLPSWSLLCPVFWDSTARPWACLWGSFQCMGILPVSGLPLLAYTLLSRSSLSFPFLCLHPLSYLISGSLACPSWRPGVFCYHLEVVL